MFNSNLFKKQPEEKETKIESKVDVFMKDPVMEGLSEAEKAKVRADLEWVESEGRIDNRATPKNEQKAA